MNLLVSCNAHFFLECSDSFFNMYTSQMWIFFCKKTTDCVWLLKKCTIILLVSELVKYVVQWDYIFYLTILLTWFISNKNIKWYFNWLCKYMFFTGMQIPEICTLMMTLRKEQGETICLKKSHRGFWGRSIKYVPFVFQEVLFILNIFTFCVERGRYLICNKKDKLQWDVGKYLLTLCHVAARLLK